MSINIKRLSDAKTMKLEVDPNVATVAELKSKIRKEFPPSCVMGCKLSFNGELLKSEDTLKECGITANATIEMDDSENWESESTENSDSDGE